MKRPPTTDLKFPLKYEKGKRFITRKDSTKEAVRPFDALCNDLYGSKFRQYYLGKFPNSDEKVIQKLVQKRVEEMKQIFREKGFDQQDYEQCCNHYDQMKGRAPRKKVRKRLDAMSLPKMTNTEEDKDLARGLMLIREHNLAKKSSSGGLKVDKTS